MAVFGWVIIGAAFLLFIMVANNSWPWVWNKIRSGIPQPGEGNAIETPAPEGSTTPFQINPPGLPNTTGPTPGTIEEPAPEGSQTPFQITPVP